MTAQIRANLFWGYGLTRDEVDSELRRMSYDKKTDAEVIAEMDQHFCSVQTLEVR